MNFFKFFGNCTRLYKLAQLCEIESHGSPSTSCYSGDRSDLSKFSPYRLLEEGGSNANGHSQQLYNNYSKDCNGSQEQYSYKDTQELKHFSSIANASPFKGSTDIYQKSNDLHQLYNNTSRSSPACKPQYGPYRGPDSNGNPYSEESTSPYKPPPPPKVKPVPPPKPVKPARTIFNSGTDGNSNSSFYLNVPVMGNRGVSAFEVYGKDTRPCEDEGSTSVRILPEVGGVLECCGVKLIIPPGSLDSPQEIQIHVHENPYSTTGNNRVLSPLVKLSPEGLQFQIPVELILPPSFYPSQGSESLCSNEKGSEVVFVRCGQNSEQIGEEDSSIRLLLDKF